MPDAVVLAAAVDVVVVVDTEPAQHRDLSPAPWLLPLTRLVNHLVDNIHPDSFNLCLVKGFFKNEACRLIDWCSLRGSGD